MFLLILDKLLPHDAPVEINIDSHLNKRKGPKIKGLGYHRDAVASSKHQKVLATGHNWLVAAVLPPFPTSKRGRPRIVGKRLPALETLAHDKTQKWVRVQVP